MKMILRKTCTALILLCLLPISALGIEQAELVFTNGKLYTVKDKQPWAEAVAVTGENIVFVGSNAEAKKYIGDKTEVVDLEGRMVLPGLVDTHMHVRIAGQMNSVMLNLFPTMGGPREVAEELIREHAKTLGPDDWVLGTGFDYDHFKGATRQELDKLTGGRPAILTSNSQHNGWYSTRALEYFGITKDTKDPRGGIIDREPDGSPSGYLQEKAHIKYGFEAMGRLFTHEQQETAIKTAVALYNEQGITSVVEVASESKEGGEDVYKRLYDKGELGTRVTVAMLHMAPDDDKKNHDSLLARSKAFAGDENLDVPLIKFAIDGTPGSMAAMSEPYLDGRQQEANYSQERLNKVFDDLTEDGLRIYVHAEGDLGIEYTINAFEYANKTGKPLSLDDRHVITHLDHVQPGQIKRMKSLNIIANIQPHWAAVNDYNETVLFRNVKKELIDIMYPFRDMQEAGLNIAIGADWPTGVEWTPWELIEVGLTRQNPGGVGDKFPGDPLTLEEMIHGFTMGSAYLMKREDIIGSLEVGKRADLIVLDRDIFEVAKSKPTDIHNTRVLLTLFNGDPVWGATNFAKVSPSGRESVEFGDYMEGHVSPVELIDATWKIKPGNE